MSVKKKTIQDHKNCNRPGLQGRPASCSSSCGSWRSSPCRAPWTAPPLGWSSTWPGGRSVLTTLVKTRRDFPTWELLLLLGERHGGALLQHLLQAHVATHLCHQAISFTICMKKLPLAQSHSFFERSVEFCLGVTRYQLWNNYYSTPVLLKIVKEGCTRQACSSHNSTSLSIVFVKSDIKKNKFLDGDTV